jgi:hypothetical protein
MFPQQLNIMTIDQALRSIKDSTEWKIIMEFLEKEREMLINDFHTPELMDAPQALARLGGEISTLDRIIRTFNNGQSQRD